MFCFAKQVLLCFAKKSQNTNVIFLLLFLFLYNLSNLFGFLGRQS